MRVAGLGMLHQTALVMGLLCCAGCGGSNTYPVRGQLVWTDGTSVTELGGGTIMFESDNQPVNVSARGEIKADGTFHMSTHKPDDGVPPGTYKVLVMQPPEDGNDSLPKKKILHKRFWTTQTSGLKATVEPKANEIKLTVERAAGKR